MRSLISLWYLVRWRAERRLAKRIQKECAGGLLILISTQSNFRIVRMLARITPLWISTGKLATENLRYVRTDYLLTPPEIVRLAAAHEMLPRIVVSFPDQMQGEGPSFVEVEFAGALRRMSLLELLLVRRHHPTVHTVQHDADSNELRLRAIDIAASQQSALDLGVKQLLAPIEPTLANPPDDWLAERVFASKSASASAARFRDDVRDVESLLRLLAEHSGTNYGTMTRILDRLDQVTRGAPNVSAPANNLAAARMREPG